MNKILHSSSSYAMQMENIVFSETSVSSTRLGPVTFQALQCYLQTFLTPKLSFDQRLLASSMHTVRSDRAIYMSQVVTLPTCTLKAPDSNPDRYIVVVVVNHRHHHHHHYHHHVVPL
jgi:hypothetical protein